MNCHTGDFHAATQQGMDGMHGSRQEAACGFAWNLSVRRDIAASGDDTERSICRGDCHGVDRFALRLATDACFDVPVGLIGRHKNFVRIVLPES